MTTTTDFRPALRAAYLKAFDNFATDPSEVGENGAALLARLERDGLVTRQDVNGAEIVWQCFETYDSISRTTAIRRFDKVYPKGQPVETIEPAKTGRKGATGAKYTEAQFGLGFAARERGLSWPEVAKAAGVKSPFHFSKALRVRFPELATSSVSGRNAPADKPAAAAKPAKKATKKAPITGDIVLAATRAAA
jgi:hypothetical protein